jgi:hypothetical protein
MLGEVGRFRSGVGSREPPDLLRTFGGAGGQSLVADLKLEGLAEFVFDLDSVRWRF